MIDELPDRSFAPPRKAFRKTPPATPAVQAWLDGEQKREQLTEPDENETAELWTRINNEAAQRRNRSTPIHLQHKIMSSLPDMPQRAVVPEPASEGPGLRISPVLMAIGAIVVLAVGALLGTMLVR
jgi:hypothetical protein